MKGRYGGAWSGKSRVCQELNDTVERMDVPGLSARRGAPAIGLNKGACKTEADLKRCYEYLRVLCRCVLQVPFLWLLALA